MANPVNEFTEGMNGGPVDLRPLDPLIAQAYKRLRLLTCRMLRHYPAILRWESPEDVLQGALVRLVQALRGREDLPPGEFWHFAAQLIRHELLRLTRHFQKLPDMVHRVPFPGRIGKGRCDPSGPERVAEEEVGEMWEALHQGIQSLAPAEQEAFSLRWYGGLSVAETASVLGISPASVRRRWQRARSILARNLGDER